MNNELDVEDDGNSKDGETLRSRAVASHNPPFHAVPARSFTMLLLARRFTLKGSKSEIHFSYIFIYNRVALESTITTVYPLNFVETPRTFTIPKLAISNKNFKKSRGVSTKLNRYIDVHHAKLKRT